MPEIRDPGDGVDRTFDYNRLTMDDESRNINSAVVLFTQLPIPAGIALALLQALGSKDPWLFGSVLAAFAVLTGLLMLTRPARLVCAASAAACPFGTYLSANRQPRPPAWRTGTPP